MTCVYTSGVNELLLPEGVTSITVTAIGGRGGSFGIVGELPGGRAAEVTGIVALPPGTRALYAVVGGNGVGAIPGPDPIGGVGGANGGGTGGSSDGATPYAANPGAGGGGASDVRTVPGDLATRLAVAAGGGGSGGADQRGGDAGAPGQKRNDGSAAQAGTPISGGVGGVLLIGSQTESSGADGALGVGGAGASSRNGIVVAGGGGGGGLYGGGGGSVVGSGAGGSSLAPAGTSLSLSDAAPSVRISYQPPLVTPQPPTCTGSACLPIGLFGSS